MSKETFSKKISETMYKKTKAIEYLDLKALLEKDEDFEIAICLAYMSLSKEKIIEKDIKNDDRLARLTQKVDTLEIDKVFQNGFAKEMPKIIYARENNNLWILDNIRDSIMHGACDIDEERKIFIINNTQYNRELKAEIPFSWFIAYAKNDILSKKISNNHTIKNYYYNKSKENKKNLDTRKELFSNILYRVNIYGSNFNITDIENRINELFLLYSNDDISDELIEKYKNQIGSEKIKYNEKYLVSFYNAKQKVIDTIKKEFPGVTIKIFIDNRKHRFVNKAVKKMPQYFTDYNTMFNTFNTTLSPKGISQLRFISHIIESISINQNNDEEYENISDWKKTTIMLHKMLTGVNVRDDKINNLSQILNQDLKILQSIYLNIYGLSTLVINHETLYNKHFLNRKPFEFGINAYLKRPYLEYASKRKTLIMKSLDIQILLANKQEQISKCNNDNAKKIIQANINDLTTKLEEIDKDLINLAPTISFDKVIKHDLINHQQRQKLETIINQYFSDFNTATKTEEKRKIRKVIGKFLDIQIEEEAKYTYGYCNNMQEVLTIIRNCFSHIGRIYIGKNNIILNDYDTNGQKSGEVICKYIDLIELLKDPYEKEKQHASI